MWSLPHSWGLHVNIAEEFRNQAKTELYCLDNYYVDWQEHLYKTRQIYRDGGLWINKKYRKQEDQTMTADFAHPNNSSTHPIHRCLNAVSRKTKPTSYAVKW